MTLAHASSALKKYFGYDRFRPLQAEIIQTVYDKKDALVLMPTGGGKSICYQIPAITMDGVAVIVSPLIALMKDQVEGLSENGIPAAYINSTLTPEQTRNVENALLAGYVKLLYVSPEKLVSQGFQPLLKRLKISLFAVDEAHCISAWGHDFRPEYTQLRFLKEQFPDVPMLALTATADKLTRKDIVDQLQLRDPVWFVASFDRPNIKLTVRPGQRRFEQIVDFLKQHPNQSGIIYCLARKTCEELAEKLNARGFRAAHYHAEVPPAQRSKTQEDFINDRTPIICATIAFGMGIDKSNVRFVIHYNLPRNLEGYYQEVGRCGRDGLPAEALLFFSYQDVMVYRDMIEQGEASPEQKALKVAKLERMYQFAEAPVCRRKTVLFYFGEPYDRSCGNCDVCLNPPRQFDGTVAAQKALSAILRTGEKVGMNLLIDILRGSRRQEVIENNFHQIKTYGAGKEYAYDDWLFLLSQMLHTGLIEIAYDAQNQLRVTEEGRKVLFEGKKVPLAMPQPKAAKPGEKGRLPHIPEKSKSQLLKEDLFNRLVALRRSIAQQQGVPPYLIFNDATLDDMADKRPLTDADILQVSGVGERKLQLYGDAFIGEIRRFVLEKKDEGARVTGSSQLVTWELFKKGHTLNEIAEMRQISAQSVTTHLAQMYERGETLDLDRWVSPEECDIIQGALPLFEEPYQMKAIYEHFNERYNYDKIRFAIADARRARK
ncbi:MAG: DNA helicase RecQ [Haliscomenobacteraceae bacterium CHB4]|nr:ATP-dependent DNA helicase RecQ [Saprospiraceae bacterium]MCE7922322.1 DNA helicase RecQ [Haliscomenobacteraceae bacterium CHB4]